MGFSFLSKALRLIFKAFSIRFVYTCSLHVPFRFPCPPTPPIPPIPPTHPISDHYPTTIRPLSDHYPTKSWKTIKHMFCFKLFGPWQVFFHFFNENHRKSSKILLLHPGWGWGNTIFFIYIIYIYFIFVIYASTVWGPFFEPI